MIDVVFGYDVEDVYNPASDDAVMQIARIHAEEGVPASMFIAAEKARCMRERGRRDALDALAQHEICYHGNYWGDFPEPATRYGVRLPFDEAVEMALHVEARGLHDVAEITGQFPVAWCCHQAQQSLPMQYAMKLAGVRCWGALSRDFVDNAVYADFATGQEAAVQITLVRGAASAVIALPRVLYTASDMGLPGTHDRRIVERVEFTALGSADGVTAPVVLV